MQITTSGTLNGKAGTATAVTYTIMGDRKASGVDSYEVLGQGQLPTSTGALLTTSPVAASTQLLIASIQITNTTASPVSGIVLYINGTAAANQVVQLSLVANGSAVYTKGEWKTYDAGGNILAGSGLGTAATKNVGNTVLDPGTGKLEFANPFAGRVTATSKTYTALDRGYFYERINGGSAMTDTLPTLTNTTADIGYTVGVHNKGTTVAETITFTDGAGNVIGDSATSYTLQYGCRQTFIWTGTKWLFGAGNGNLTKSPTVAPVASNLAAFTDTTGRQLIDSGISATTVNGKVGSVTAGSGKIVIGGTATAPTVDVGTGIPESSITNLTTDLAAKAPTSRLINTTAPLTGGGDLSADRTLAISAATTSTPGSLSAANYSQINNWFGSAIFHVDDYGVSPANSAATNVTNMNTLLQTTAPDKSKIVFGAGTYQFSAGLTTLTHDFAFEGNRGLTTIAITGDMGAATPFINCSNAGFYTSFRDLNFVNFHSQTTNTVINFQNNSTPQIQDCFFSGASNWVDVLTFSGTQSGDGAYIKNVYIAQWSGKAIYVSSALSTMYVEDLLIVGAGVSGSSGFYCDNGGAALMSNCQIISADVNVNLNPATGKTVSAIFAVNCFFDQGKTNSLLITGAGTGTNARHHFVASWFTVAGTSSIGGAGTNCKAIQITTAGTGIHAGIEFQACWIMNATPGSTGTLEGINATSVQDLTVTSCQFAAWTNDIQVTPASANTCAIMLTGNNFDNAGLLTASTNNVILNAGSFTYRSVNVNSNVFGGSTTRLTDNSAMAGAGVKNITGNSGIVQPGIVSAFATTRPNLTASALNLVGGTSIQIPTNGLRVGSQFRFTIALDKTAAGVATWTAKVKFGVNNTTADAEIASWTSGTNTAAAEGANLVIDVNIGVVGASATCTAQATYQHQLLAATGLGSIAPAPTATTAFNSTVANPWLHVDITPGAAAVMTAVGRAEVIV